MNKHKWEGNTCVKCSVERIRKTKKLLMAIVNHPPYNCYTYETVWHYSIGGFKRPECKKATL